MDCCFMIAFLSGKVRRIAGDIDKLQAERRKTKFTGGEKKKEKSGAVIKEYQT